MSAPTEQLTSVNFARIFVALQRALTIVRPRNASSPLLAQENLWALSVLLGERAYRAAGPPAEAYSVAVQALGPLAGDGPLWPIVVEAGDATDRAESLRAAEKLGAQLAKIGIDLVASLATEARLASFRAAARRIVTEPSPLPSLDSLFGASLGDDSLPASRAIAPVMPQPPRGVGVKVLVYGLPVLGGITLVAGAIRFLNKRGVQEHGR